MDEAINNKDIAVTIDSPEATVPPRMGVVPSPVLPTLKQVEENAVLEKVPEKSVLDEIGNSIKATKESTILTVMRIINLLLGAGTVAAGVLPYVVGAANNFDEIVASLYIILFGLLLFAFELRNEHMDKKIQLYFGFMYGYKTRTMFLLFMAIWPLSINYWVNVLDSVLLFVNAFFNLYVIYHHPSFASPALSSPSKLNHVEGK